jgi:hypothetical protein
VAASACADVCSNALRGRGGVRAHSVAGAVYFRSACVALMACRRRVVWRWRCTTRVCRCLAIAQRCTRSIELAVSCKVAHASARRASEWQGLCTHCAGLCAASSALPRGFDTGIATGSVASVARR